MDESQLDRIEAKLDLIIAQLADMRQPARDSARTQPSPPPRQGAPTDEDPIPASPSKLQEGGWGARIDPEHDPQPGDVVQVTTRGGKSWTDRVDRVVYRGDGFIKVTLQSDSSRAASRPPQQQSATAFAPSGPRNERVGVPDPPPEDEDEPPFEDYDDGLPF